MDSVLFMDSKLIRQKSLQIAADLGFPVNESLPLLEDHVHEKSAEEIIRRLLSLHVVAACAYGFDRIKASTWIHQEGIAESLTLMERIFIEKGTGDANQFKVQVEAMWALAWALGMVTQLDFSKGCDSQFVILLPNLKLLENSAALRAKTKPRSYQQILEKCDLSYCLHWAIRQAEFSNQKLPGKVQPYVIVERRRALEWLVGSEGWGDFSLDT